VSVVAARLRPTPSCPRNSEALLEIHRAGELQAFASSRTEKDPCAVGSSSGALVVPVLVVPCVVVDTPVLASRW